MKFNKLFASIAAAIVFLPIQPTYAWLTKCGVTPYDKSPAQITCGSDSAGGYVVVKNNSSPISPATIRVSSAAGTTIEVKPGAVSPLFYMASYTTLLCEGCTPDNVTLKVALQCNYPPTVAEERQSRCK